MTNTAQLFTLGRTLITATAQAAVEELQLDALVFIRRHHSGDWGDLCAADQAANVEAITTGSGRLFSSYKVNDEVTLYVVTEADRSATTVMLSTDY